jgi:prolipoprotein diacylglyceryltransferase
MIAGALEYATMPVSALPFPNIDPILISIGPFAIRWYALAYIFGIILGWVYARYLIKRERFWGGPAPLTVTDFDDYIVWVTLGIILGGRIGYVLFPPTSPHIRLRFFRSGPAACRFMAALSAACWR